MVRIEFVGTFTQFSASRLAMVLEDICKWAPLSLSDQSISLTSLKGQGFAGHEDKVGSLVLAVHLVFSVGRV